jgi:hypothetical protein
LEQIWQNDSARLADQYFADGQLRQAKLYSADQRDVEMTSYTNEALHGSYFCRLGQRTWEGQFRNGERNGPWKMTFHDGDEMITTQQNYRDDKPHGDWTWTTATGEVLQSARFERGELVLWNGSTVRAELQHWCDAHKFDRNTRELLALPATSMHGSRIPSIDNHTRAWPITQQHRLLLHLPRREAHDGFLELLVSVPNLDRPLGEVLVEQSLSFSRIPSLRFGTFCVVPITKSELEWRDRTGVLNVHFEKPSCQTAWEELRAGRLSFPNPDGADGDKTWRAGERKLKNIFDQTEIEFDVSRLPVESAPESGDYAPRDTRSRRDVLGLLLSSRGWSCEQQGSVIVIHPHPAKEESN